MSYVSERERERFRELLRRAAAEDSSDCIPTDVRWTRPRLDNIEVGTTP